jgi:hypothetical protein
MFNMVIQAMDKFAREHVEIHRQERVEFGVTHRMYNWLHNFKPWAAMSRLIDACFHGALVMALITEDGVACNDINDEELKVANPGVDHSRLKQFTKPSVVSETDIADSQSVLVYLRSGGEDYPEEHAWDSLVRVMASINPSYLVLNMTASDLLALFNANPGCINSNESYVSQNAYHRP